MPMFDLTLQAGALDADARAQLVEDLTTKLLQWEGAPDNPATRALSWGFVHELPEDAVNRGGKPAEPPIYRVFLTVPQGTPGLHGPLNAERRSGLTREVTECVLAAEGETDVETHGHRVWCMIREQADGFWGSGGQIYTMNDIAAVARSGQEATAMPA
jgi:phenylpyruvate tautomerase PptA (4-oxalocrotonate tautomerase family)